MFEKEAEDSFKCKKVLYKWETDKRSYIDGSKTVQISVIIRRMNGTRLLTEIYQK